MSFGAEDSKAEYYLKVKLKYSDIEQKVSCLQAVNQCNPFDCITVTFPGTSPDGKVTITPDYNQKEMQYVRFAADRISGIKNGDSIVDAGIISSRIERWRFQWAHLR